MVVRQLSGRLILSNLKAVFVLSCLELLDFFPFGRRNRVAWRVLEYRHEYACIQSQPEEWRICEAVAPARKPLGASSLWPAGCGHRGIFRALCRRIDFSAAAHLKSRALREINARPPWGK